MTAIDKVVGVVLAGGRSSRMHGQFKAEAEVGGTALLNLVIERIKPQVAELLINLNQQSTVVNGQNYRIVPDTLADYPGPLAGLAAAFEYLDAHGIDYDAVAVAPCDGPFIPRDLVARLTAALVANQAVVACARYAGEAQPTFSLWRKAAGPMVISRLKDQRQGGFKGLLQALPTAFVDWSAAEINPFFNINTPEELQQAQQMVESVNV